MHGPMNVKVKKLQHEESVCHLGFLYVIQEIGMYEPFITNFEINTLSKLKLAFNPNKT